MDFRIRPYHPSDLPSVYEICLRTGNHGEDATSSYAHRQLLGHYYAGPYAVLEPDLCFILTADGEPCGYVLGTRDSTAFWSRCEAEWFPALRERYPLPPPEDKSPDAEMKRAIHRGIEPGYYALEYPAHLHIDLLPQAVGGGNGRRMMETFLDRLRELDVPAVHLGVSRKNERAVGYYEHMGFERLREYDWGYAMGLRLGGGRG
jgi:ribosomal protein S18 acetylase RimI-like enzyme